MMTNNTLMLALIWAKVKWVELIHSSYFELWLELMNYESN